MARRRAALPPPPMPMSTGRSYGPLARLGVAVGGFLLAVATLAVVDRYVVTIPQDVVVLLYVGIFAAVTVAALFLGRRNALIAALIVGVAAAAVFAVQQHKDGAAAVTQDVGDGGQGLVGWIKTSVHNMRDGDAK